jgi:phage terminase large subunit-like protein
VGAGSPDRADAAIWALTELMLDTEPQPNIRFFDF